MAPTWKVVCISAVHSNCMNGKTQVWKKVSEKTFENFNDAWTFANGLAGIHKNLYYPHRPRQKLPERDEGGRMSTEKKSLRKAKGPWMILIAGGPERVMETDEDGNESTCKFRTLAAAKKDLREHFEDCENAGMDCDPEDYRIVPYEEDA